MSVGSRNRNPTYILIAGIVVALLGGILVVVLLSQGNVSVPGQSSQVVVAAHDIAAKAQIKSGDLTTVNLPSNSVPGHSFSSVNDVKGFAAVALPKNTPITSDALVSAPAAAPASTSQGVLDIPAGQVAVAIPAGDPINNVAGFVQSGDKVDILVRNIPGQTPGQVATTFTNLTIQLANNSSAGGRSPSGNAWVVFVPSQQAMQLIYLFNSGQYTFVLRSPQDSGSSGAAPPPVGKSEFNSAFGIH